MAFCPNCGTEVGGQFCPKCGTNVAGAVPTGTVTPTRSSGLAPNIAAAICYFPLIGLIFLLIEPYNKDRNIRFHAWQSICLAIALFVLQIAIGIVGRIFASVSTGLGLMVGLLSSLVSFAGLILFIYLAFKTYQNQRIVLPVIGQFAEKQA